MIKNVSDRLSKINNYESYLKYGTMPVSPVFCAKNFDLTKDEFVNQNNATNPIIQEKNAKKPEIQDYFEQQYKEIKARVQNVVDRFSKDGVDKKRFDYTICELNAMISRYELDGSTQTNDIEKTYELQKGAKTNILIQKNRYNETLSETEFSNGQISKITLFNDDNTKSNLYFSKRGFLNNLLDLGNSKLSLYQKVDEQGNILESLKYSKNSKPDKYSSYKNGIEEYSLVFDIHNLQDEINSYNKTSQKLIPLTYTSYGENEQKEIELEFEYSRPSKYLEYDKDSSRIIKSFNIRGLTPKVYKYSFYSAINSQVLSAGTI